MPLSMLTPIWAEPPVSGPMAAIAIFSSAARAWHGTASSKRESDVHGRSLDSFEVSSKKFLTVVDQPRLAGC